jgi:hypothetical protein
MLENRARLMSIYPACSQPNVMKPPGELEVRCDDFLKDNRHFYVSKARRKKIALISVQVVNKSAARAQLFLDASKLIVDDRTYHLERCETVIRKLSEFTWDFLLYLILDFHPVAAAVDICVFLSGPIYNRRLRKQLGSLCDREIFLMPGESKKVQLGFHARSEGPRQLQLPYCCGGETRQLQCDIG